MKNIKVSINVLYVYLTIPFIILFLFKILDIFYYVFFDKFIDRDTILILWGFVTFITYVLFYNRTLQKDKYKIEDLIEDLRYTESDLRNIIRERMIQHQNLYQSKDNSLPTFPYSEIIKDYINKQNK